MTAARMNGGKPQMDFLLDFPIFAEALCRVMELGAEKYDRDNWKLGGKPDSEYLGAAIRHLMAHKSGELYADDSGCLHLAHAAWNLMALIELNVKETHDPALFAEMVEKWKTEKSIKAIPGLSPEIWSGHLLQWLQDEAEPDAVERLRNEVDRAVLNEWPKYVKPAAEPKESPENVIKSEN